MYQISSKNIPEKDDYVLGVVEKITKHGVYVQLIEYSDNKGYIHISEITSSWVRNIRNFVRQGQQIVVKVLRVTEATNQIDLSLKRVSNELKEAKILEYKKQSTALSLIKLISERAKIEETKLRKLLEEEFINKYHTLYNGFEELVFAGIEVLNPLNLDDETNQYIYDAAIVSVKIPKFTLIADLAIRSFASDGVSQVKKLLKIAEKICKENLEVESDITSIGSPQYRIYMEGRLLDDLIDLYTSLEKQLEASSKNIDVEYKIMQQKN